MFTGEDKYYIFSKGNYKVGRKGISYLIVFGYLYWWLSIWYIMYG